MWSYENGSGRRNRDIPPSSSRRYYGSVYDQPYDDAPPASASTAHTRHRRKSVPVNLDDARPSRRANVVASDDGFADPYARTTSRDPYAGLSRHDAEAKTSDRNRHFRDKRENYEADEAQNLRRAKSYSPKGAAREFAEEQPRHASPQAPPKSSWQHEDYGAAAAAEPPRRSSARKSSRKEPPQQQYYEEEAWAGRGKSRERANGGVANGAYEYGSSPTGMPPPPMGDYKPYKSSPMASSTRGPEEKVGRHSRGREKPYYGGYEAYPPEPEPPRRERHGRHAEERPAWDDDGYPPRSRGKHRPPPPPAAAAAAPPPPAPAPAPADDYEDPYARAPRARHRQSMPPQARSRYEDPYEDPYGPPPRRRATSAGYGHHGAYGDAPRDRRLQDERFQDERVAPPRYNSNSSGSSGGGGSGGGGSSARKEKGKKIGKQAGKLFMTHAFPVIKQEAVPFLTKAAQAYFEQSKK